MALGYLYSALPAVSDFGLSSAILALTNDHTGSPGTTAAAIPRSSEGFEGDMAARAGAGLAELLPIAEEQRRGDRTDRRAVPAGWLSLLKLQPANLLPPRAQAGSVMEEQGTACC